MTGKQLRNSILQWAIQGKLVPQNPNDEPASILIEKIRAEKARLIKEGKIKKDKKESIIFRGEDNSYYEKFANGKVVCIDEEIPFEIPASWSYARLGNICSYLHRGKSPKYGNQKKLPIIAQKCNQWDKLYIDRCLFSDIDYILKYKEEQFLQKGDIIINSTGGGTVGRTGYIDESIFEKYDKFVADSHVTVVRPTTLISHRYIYMYLLSPYIQIGIEERCSGSTNQIELGTATIYDYIVPIPPVEEQKKIVRKIKEILPLVEKYTHSQTLQDKLNDSIKTQLRKSILQEAIQGHLVLQDADDEPASVLLQRIKEEKQRLVKEGKLKKKDSIDSVIFKGDDNKYYEQIGGKVDDITEEIPFDVPDGWSWCHLKSICTIFTGATFKKEDARTDKQGIRILRGGNILPFEIAFKPDDIFLPCNLVKENILIQKNDIVTPAVTSLENIGKMARVIDHLPDVTVGGFVFVLRLYYSNDWLSQYLLVLMSSPTIIEYIKSITNKSGQAFYNIGKERLATTLLPIPPLNEQQRIVSQIEKIFCEIKAN